MKPTCPHCGNTNPKTIQDNGCTGRDRTFLCVARVEESSFDDPGEPDANGLFECGAQWDAVDQEED